MLAALGAPAAAQSPAAPSPCAGSIGIGLVDVPTQRQEDPRARAYIVDHVEPGDALQRRVRVCNGTSSDVVVQLYAGAATIDGASFTAVEGRMANELSGWIQVSPGRMTVPAGGAVLATVRVAVPADASGGERYAAVLVEAPAVEQPNGFAVASRVGVRVYLSVGGPTQPSSDYAVDSLRAARRSDGRPVVQARVRNTGERALDMRGELRLTDGPGGLSAGPFPATLGTTLAIGRTAPVEILLDPAVTGGPWTATLTLTSGLTERRAQARIAFPDGAGERAAAVAAENLSLREDPRVLIPVASGLIGLVALVLLALLRRRWMLRKS